MAEKPKSWSLYFPNEDFDLADRRVKLIEALLSFWLTPQAWDHFLCLLRVGKDGYLVLRLDYDQLIHASELNDLHSAIEHQPTECLGCLGASVYEVLFETDKNSTKLNNLLGFRCQPQKVTIQPFNVQNAISIRSIQSGSIGKLVCIKGTVVRMMPCQPAPTQVTYACGKCQKRILVDCPNCRPEPPKACSEGCRSKQFQPVADGMRTTDWQKIRIQELLAVSQQDAQGAAARTIDAELIGDSVRTCTCGDVVSILGFVRVVSVDQGSRSKSGVMLLYLDVASVVNHTAEESMGTANGKDSARGFTMKDLHFICTFAQTCAPHQLLHLAHSLCPSILGHGAVKVGIVLALLGGAGGGATGGHGLRSTIHALLVGDPGLGKSQLLRAAAAAAPRGMYVCSLTSTGAGLTVSVAKDTVTNDMALEAGALVLADQGVCCLDELDSMRSEHKTLLEVMEQQEVCVAKAGLTARMPARTTVIAAANPVGGTFCRAKTLQENLKMSAALFSRFDLVFAMIDDADEAADQRLSKHVMDVHSSVPAGPEVLRLTASNKQSAAQGLVERADNFQCTNPLPVPLVKRYISYARRYCQPCLSHEAKLILKAFYLTIRQLAATCTAVPVTARQLDTLVRLAHARARADLRGEVTRRDAEEVVELMKFSMRDLFRDELPFIHVARAGRGGCKAEVNRLLAALKQLKHGQKKQQWSVAELHGLADDLGIHSTPMADLIGILNESGDLLKKGPQLYTFSA